MGWVTTVGVWVGVGMGVGMGVGVGRKTLSNPNPYHINF